MSPLNDVTFPLGNGSAATMSTIDLKAVVGRPDLLPWQPFRPGVEIAWLYGGDDANKASSAFLRYAPGARVPHHTHGGYEHVFVLAGTQRDHRGVYGAGTLIINPPGTSHAVDSPEGCLALLVWERPVVVTEAQVTQPLQKGNPKSTGGG